MDERYVLPTRSWFVYMAKFDNIRDKCLSDQSKHLEITYCNMFKVTKRLIGLGLLDVKKIGRGNLYTPTEEGEIVIKACKTIWNILDSKSEKEK